MKRLGIFKIKIYLTVQAKVAIDRKLRVIIKEIGLLNRRKPRDN